MTILKLSGLVTAGLLLAGPGNAAEVELWRLDCGTIQVNDLDLFSDTYLYVGQKKELTDSCYLIRHDASYLLWDSGLPAGLLNKPATADVLSPTLTTTLPTQLDELGLEPGQVSLLGISHYHFDHVGQAADFTRAKLLIGAADLAAMRADPPPFGAQPDLLAPWLDGQRPVETVQGDKDVFGDGTVTMLAMPGHTPGQHALLVRLAKTGPVLLGADVVHFEGQFANNGVPSFNTDRGDTLASMDRTRRMAENLKAILVVQHDPDDVAKLPSFPASAE